MDSQIKIPIIYFHSIQDSPDPTWSKNFLTVEVELFELFLKYLKANRWHTLFLDEMYDLRKRNSRLKGKYCCLTFDDGYLDNYIFAYPLLHKYGFKGTIFVSPECVDLTRGKSATLVDIWNGRQDPKSLIKSAYLTWQEMCEMQDSGVIDIQSHTMSHTKYYATDRIVSYHHPADNCFYPIINRFPKYVTAYFQYKDFEKLIRYGTPLFEERSAVVTKRHEADEDFEREIIGELETSILSDEYDFDALTDIVKPVYQHFREKGKILHCIESDVQYKDRQLYEIIRSKEILEEKLGKEVSFLCWPHGDNDPILHKMALEAGYKATSVGKSKENPGRIDRFERTGIHVYRSQFLTKLGIRYKLRSFANLYPDYLIRSFRSQLRNIGGF